MAEGVVGRLPSGVAGLVKGIGRSPWHLLVAALVCGSAVATGLAVAGNRDGMPSTRFAAIASAAWLPSDAVGQMSLVDGQSADTLAQVAVAPDDTHLDVAQADSDAFTIDGTGLLTRIDGATLGTASALPLGHRNGMHVYAGADSVVVHDPLGGVASTLDAATLHERSRTPLPASGEDGTTVADDAGRLWTVGRDGHVLSLDESGLHPTAVIAEHPEHAKLVLVRGRPVLVDPSAAVAVAVDPGTGMQAEASCLPAGAARAAVSGSPSRGRVYLTDPVKGALLVADLDEHSCGQGVALGKPGADLGPALEVGDLLLVANRTTSTVAIVDSRTWTIVTVDIPVPHGHRLQLLRHAGAVFYNDPQSEQAGVISLDGRVRPARKYDPAAPGHGLKGLGTPRTSVGRTLGGTQTGTLVSSGPVSTSGTTTVPSGSPSAPVSSAAVPRLEITVGRPRTPEVGRPFRFGLFAPAGVHPVSALWTFGDGRSAEGLTAEHSYTAEGPYLVSAVVTLDDGRTAVATQVITVRDGTSVQIVGISPDSALVGQPTPFSATYSGGTPRTYEWQVLDPSGGLVAASRQAEPVFTFPLASQQVGGAYRVVLRVDGDASASVAVVVGAAVPTSAWVECQPSTVETGGEVSCTASASGVLRAWEWTIRGPAGSHTWGTGAQFSTVTFSFTASDVGSYQISVVPINEWGRGEPARTNVTAATTAAALSVGCSTDPLHVDRPTPCTISVRGWPAGASLAGVWTVDGTGNRAGQLEVDSTGVSGDVLTVGATVTPPSAGVYRVHLEYRDARGALRSLDSRPLTVTTAQWTLVLSVHGDGAVTDGSHTCRSDNPPCQWLLDDGARVVLIAQGGPQQVPTWGGDCAGQGGVGCVLTMTSSHLVDVTFRTGTPTTSTTGTSTTGTSTTGTHTTTHTTTTRPSPTKTTKHSTTRKTTKHTTGPSPTGTSTTTTPPTTGPSTTTTEPSSSSTTTSGTSTTKTRKHSRSTRTHRSSGCEPTMCTLSGSFGW